MMAVGSVGVVLGEQGQRPCDQEHCREDGEFALQRPTPHHDRAINITTTMMTIHCAASRIGSWQHDSSPDDAPSPSPAITFPPGSVKEA